MRILYIMYEFNLSLVKFYLCIIIFLSIISFSILVIFTIKLGLFISNFITNLWVHYFLEVIIPNVLHECVLIYVFGSPRHTSRLTNFFVILWLSIFHHIIRKEILKAYKINSNEFIILLMVYVDCDLDYKQSYKL